MATSSLRRFVREVLTRAERAGGGVSTAHVVWAYRLLLDREPESKQVIEHHLAASGSVKDLRDRMLASNEFRSGNGPDPLDLARTELGDLALRHFRDVDLWIHSKDVIYSGTPDSEPYEPNVDTLFRELVKPGDVVMDVGANMGYFTVLAAKLAGLDGRVFAVEVRPENAWMIRHNVRHAGLCNVDLWPVALWDRVGHHVIPKIRFNPDGIPTTNRQLGTSTLDSGAGTLVPTVPLDLLGANLTRLDLLKFDIEGAEFRAVLGARETLRRLRPRMILEFSPAYIAETSGDAGEDLLVLLRDLDYRMTIVARDGSRVECGADVERCMAEWGARAEKGVPHLDLFLDSRKPGSG